MKLSFRADLIRSGIVSDKPTDFRIRIQPDWPNALLFCVIVNILLSLPKNYGNAHSADTGYNPQAVSKYMNLVLQICKKY